MDILYLPVIVINVVFGFIIIHQLNEIKKRQVENGLMLSDYSHIRYYRGRKVFNSIGIEIVNGCVASDTIYLVMRSGTFEDDFIRVLTSFHELGKAKIVLIVPDKQVFLSNFRKEIQDCITEAYVNPYCSEARGILLKPKNIDLDRNRMRGYLFISDGHVHTADDGFYTATDYSARFLLGYFESLIKSGQKISLKEIEKVK